MADVRAAEELTGEGRDRIFCASHLGSQTPRQFGQEVTSTSPRICVRSRALAQTGQGQRRNSIVAPPAAGEAVDMTRDARVSKAARVNQTP